MPVIEKELEFFSKAFNRKVALEQGKILPLKGVDEAYDRSQEMKAELENDLNRYLREQKRHFGTDVKYWGSGNNMYQVCGICIVITHRPHLSNNAN